MLDEAGSRHRLRRHQTGSCSRLAHAKGTDDPRSERKKHDDHEKVAGDAEQQDARGRTHEASRDGKKKRDDGNRTPDLPKTRAIRGMNRRGHERPVSKTVSAITTLCRGSVDQATFWTVHRSLIDQRPLTRQNSKPWERRFLIGTSAPRFAGIPGWTLTFWTEELPIIQGVYESLAHVLFVRRKQNRGEVAHFAERFAFFSSGFGASREKQGSDRRPERSDEAKSLHDSPVWKRNAERRLKSEPEFDTRLVECGHNTVHVSYVARTGRSPARDAMMAQPGSRERERSAPAASQS
jgi:hypothetical protein